MRNVDIEIFCLAQTQVNKDEVRRWLDFIGANGFEIPSDEACTDPALLVALAAKRCYMSFQPSLNPNVQKIRTDLTEYLENVLKSGHGSVLEHAVYTFSIENVSRVFSGEMNRHRAGVGISEGSMRYIRYRDIPWWMPPSMKLTAEEQAAYDEANAVMKGFWWDCKTVLAQWPPTKVSLAMLGNKKIRTQKTFQHHYEQTEVNYAELQDIWKDELAPESKFHGKKQVTSMIRRIIPMGVATGGVWTMNLRAVRHIIALRASDGAEEEIAYVFGKIAKFITEQEPMLFGDFTQDEHGYWTPKYKKV
jgi:thymidylate synthase (FAD)